MKYILKNELIERIILTIKVQSNIIWYGCAFILNGSVGKDLSIDQATCLFDVDVISSTEIMPLVNEFEVLEFNPVVRVFVICIQICM